MEPVTNEKEVIGKLREYFSVMFPEEYFQFDSFIDVQLTRPVGEELGILEGEKGFMTDREKFLFTARCHLHERIEALKKTISDWDPQVQEKRKELRKHEVLGEMIFQLLQLFIAQRANCFKFKISIYKNWEIHLVSWEDGKSRNGNVCAGDALGIIKVVPVEENMHLSML